jgi:GH15 family glucan-1,4-alpha-glucosidase
VSSARIEDYGLIGDCQTAALVSRQGSVDWLCWPRFDSDACLAALLGGQSNGFWLVTPSEEPTQVRRRYRPDTLILETEFTTDAGTAVLTDFMLPRAAGSDLIRIVTCRDGEVTMCMELVLRFGYGCVTPWVSRLDDGALRAIAGPDMVVLRTPAIVRGENFKTLAMFTLARGKSMPFVLSYAPSHLAPPAAVDPHEALEKCEQFWREWTASTKADGPHAAAIRRSLVTLKALTYQPSGGIVAAPTTSLPEQFGGERNWDYRLCWVRDATLTLLAMMNAGLYGEAAAWRDWLQRALAGSPDDMQIMYGIMGERRLTEWTVDWLPGFADSKPVRVGNAAHEQFQLDTYGELMDAFEQARKGGLAVTEEGWGLQRALVDHVAEVWRNPDSGIWESRGPPLHYVYSKVMAWVAFDRAIKGIETWGMKGPLEQWRAERDRIRAEILDKGFDRARNTFRAAYDASHLDASLLLLAQTGFVAPDDPRFVGTVEAIERELLREGFVMRYNTLDVDDGLKPGEGVFLACSFWLADAYVSIGRLGDAEKLFARLLGVRNELGLLAEEYEPRAARLQGNFPQAFSHIALINTAFNLTRSQKPAEQRADRHDVPEDGGQQSGREAPAPPATEEGSGAPKPVGSETPPRRPP